MSGSSQSLSLVHITGYHQLIKTDIPEPYDHYALMGTHLIYLGYTLDPKSNPVKIYVCRHFKENVENIDNIKYLGIVNFNSDELVEKLELFLNEHDKYYVFWNCQRILEKFLESLSIKSSLPLLPPGALFDIPISNTISNDTNWHDIINYIYNTRPKSTMKTKSCNKCVIF